jgi:hypothetical protein
MNNVLRRFDYSEVQRMLCFKIPNLALATPPTLVIYQPVIISILSLDHPLSLRLT